MTVTTSKGKTFEINWMWGPVGQNEDLMLEYEDDRPMAEIAADFEGCESFHRESEYEDDKDFTGYTRLRSIVRAGRGKVQLTLYRTNEG